MDDITIVRSDNYLISPLVITNISDSDGMTNISRDSLVNINDRINNNITQSDDDLPIFVMIILSMSVFLFGYYILSNPHILLYFPWYSKIEPMKPFQYPYDDCDTNNEIDNNNLNGDVINDDDNDVDFSRV
jgi:hypothetical protein